MEIKKNKGGRPKKYLKKGRLQSYMEDCLLDEFDQLVEYLGPGTSRSDYAEMVLSNHVKEMRPVLKAVKAGLLVPRYNKVKGKMMFIKKEDYDRGMSLGKHVADI